MLSCWSAGAGIIAKVSRSGPSWRSGSDQRGAGARVAEVGGLHQGEVPAAQRFGHLGKRREPQDAAQRGDLVRHRGGPRAPGVQHFGGALDREEQRPGVQLADRVQRHLQRGHHADAAAAAADRPEQVRLVIGVGAAEAAVRGHDLGRGDAVGGQPVAAGQPAQPAAEGVAGHADVRGGARERGQAMLPGRDGHVLPQGAGFGAGGASGRVDAHAAHPHGPQQHRIFQRLERLRAVAGALRGDPHPAGTGEPDRLYHVGGRLGHHDDSGTLVGGEVPRLPRLVIAVVARGENVAGNRGPQRFQVAAGDGVRGGHAPMPFLDAHRSPGTAKRSFRIPGVVCRGRSADRHVEVGCPGGRGRAVTRPGS